MSTEFTPRALASVAGHRIRATGAGAYISGSMASKRVTVSTARSRLANFQMLDVNPLHPVRVSGVIILVAVLIYPFFSRKQARG